MDIEGYENLAREIAAKTGFVLGERIYQGDYYTADKVRDVIYEGTYEGKPAVLKIYDDPRLDYEALNQIAFNKANTSSILRAPEVYAYDMITPQRGWLIMEKLPTEGAFFVSPVEDKAEFARLFVEYWRSFPKEPTRELALVERMEAHRYHLHKIDRWLELANTQEAKAMLAGRKTLLGDEFLGKYGKALDLIEDEFKRRRMAWCHGHFKPHELYKISDNQYFLTDFAHNQMHAEGTDLAFIIWADWLISADWHLPYGEWKLGIRDWVLALEPVARELGIERYEELMRASLAERTLGTILADVCASDKPQEEKEMRLLLLMSLLDDLLDEESFKENICN